jgi:hypothetical protein
VKPKVGCSNSADGLNVGIHYSGKLAALQAEKERFRGIENHDSNSNMALPAKKE